MPSVWLTGLEGVLVPATKERTEAALLWREVREPLAHGFLMLGLGYSLMRLVSPHRAVDGPGRGFGEGRNRSTIRRRGFSHLPEFATFYSSETKGQSFLKSWMRRASFAIFGVLLIAVLIEGAQSLLPPSFSRGPAWGDLGASLVGGFIGSLAAILIPIR